MTANDIRAAIRAADRAELASLREEAEKERAEFLKMFPKSRWATMSLTDYALGHDQNDDNVGRWLEYLTRGLGSVGGGSAIKHGIYYHRDNGWTYNSDLYDSETAAWEAIRSGFLRAFELADQGNFEEIDSIEALRWTPMIRTKIMHMYYPDEILPVYSINHIRHFLRLLGHEAAEDKSYDVIRLNRLLLKALRSLPETKGLSNIEVMHFLYDHFAPPKTVEGGSNPFELTPDQYAMLLARFKEGLPDFKSFDEPGEMFLANEVNYKRKMQRRYNTEMGNKKARDLVAKGEGLEVIKFIGKIASNLVQFQSWRQSFGESNESATPILKAILDVVENPYEGASDLRPIFDAAESQNRRLDWSALSTMLWLMRPEDYFPIKISYYKKLAQELGWELPKGRAGANNFARVHDFGCAFRDALAPLHPQDWVDVQSFIWWVCSSGEESPAGQPETVDPVEIQLEVPPMKQALNTILYGPPGTGKTYRTIQEAVRIIDGKLPDTAKAIKARFDELVDQSRIAFVTFHQSFSYEDFVEGIRPDMSQAQGDAPRYIVRDGLFKDVCTTASDKPRIASRSQVSLDGVHFWKMSLGNTMDPDEAEIFDDCIAQNQVALGYGRDKDYSACKTKEDIAAILQNESWASDERPTYHITALDMLKHHMREGDLVIISDGNRKFRAIGRVTGPYRFKPGGYYSQTRPVEWLRVFEESQPSDRILKDRLFSMQSIYGISPNGLRLDAIKEMLSTHSEATPGNYVLIIDEINRGNISKIFGELITLLEEDKRLGADNALRVKLPYSGTWFGVPSNLYVMGTMNTADKSIALVDVALRRRFKFIELMPDYSKVNPPYADILRELNRRIALRKDRDHQIGHSYLMGVSDDAGFDRVFDDKILPLLQEYFYNDWDGLRFVLGESEENTAGFIRRLDGGDNKLARNKWAWYRDIDGTTHLSAIEELTENYKLNGSGEK